MKKKIIAILKLTFNQSGGLEKQTNLIVDALLKKGMDVHVVTTKPKSTLILPQNISFHFMRKFPLLTFLRILFFEIQTTRWVKKNMPDIVLGMDRTTSQTHIRAGNGVHRSYLENRKKYFGPFDTFLTKINPLHHLVLHIEKKAFQCRDLKKVIVNSKMVKDQIISYYNIDPQKIEVIHNGVEWSNGKSSFLLSFEKKAEIAKMLKIDSSKFMFLFVGNGYKRKGLDRILAALSKIDSRDFHLLVVGKDKNIKKYIRYGEKLGLGQNISFFGKRPSLDIFYQLSDALVLPSFYDPFANVTLEALTMGLFTITSKENGAHEIIDERNGTIIDDLNDIDAITRSLMLAMKNKKTFENAQIIRDSVRHLDVNNYLDKILFSLTTNE